MYKKHKKSLFFAIIGVVMIASIVVSLKNYFFEEKDIHDLKTTRKMTSTELSQTANEQITDSGLIEKAIEVEGKLKEVTFKHDKFTLILEGGVEDKLIICELKTDQEESVKALKKGNIVTVKGILKGHLKDAILLQCIIIDKDI